MGSQNSFPHRASRSHDWSVGAGTQGGPLRPSPVPCVTSALINLSFSSHDKPRRYRLTFISQVKNKGGSAWLRNLTKFTQVVRSGVKIQTPGGLSSKSMLLPPYQAACPPRASVPPYCEHLLGLYCLPVSQLPVSFEVPAGKRCYQQTGQQGSLSIRDCLPRVGSATANEKEW